MPSPRAGVSRDPGNLDLGVCGVSADRFEKLIRDGDVPDYAELARLGHVTRAKLSQIMDLLLLAPDIQEQILFLPAVEAGDDPMTERQLRRIVAVVDWGKQRRVWAGLCGKPVGGV